MIFLFYHKIFSCTLLSSQLHKFGIVKKVEEEKNLDNLCKVILTNHMLSNVGDIEWLVSSITQISPIALEASSSDEIEGEVDEDDEDEAEVKREKDEVEHYEIKENILWQPQQVVHGGQLSENNFNQRGRGGRRLEDKVVGQLSRLQLQLLISLQSPP